jgi:hypothetical protein
VNFCPVSGVQLIYSLCVSYIVTTAANPERTLFPVSRPIRHVPHMHLVPMSSFNSARPSKKRRMLALVNDSTASLQRIWHGRHGHCSWSHTFQRLQPLLHLLLHLEVSSPAQGHGGSIPQAPTHCGTQQSLAEVWQSPPKQTSTKHTDLQKCGPMRTAASSFPGGCSAELCGISATGA